MSRLVPAVLALALLVAGALFLAPRFIDPATTRDLVAAGLSRAAGRPVAIAGPASFALLPSPRLVAEDVTLAPDAAHPVSFRAARLEAALAPVPLLAGRIEPRRLTLVAPVFDLTGAPGRLLAALAAGAAPGPVGLIDIRDGRVSGLSPGGSAVIDGLGVTVTAPAGGPWHASGRLRYAGLPLAVSLDLSPGPAPAGFGLTISAEEVQFRLTLDGQLAATPAGLAASGQLSLATGDAAALLARLGAGRDAPIRKLAATAQFVLSPAGLRLDGLDLALDGGEGRGSLSVPRGDLSAAHVALGFGRFDLDRQLAVSPVPAGALLASLAAPAAPGGTAELDAAALVWHGAVLRDARVAAALGRGGLTLQRAAAIAPGGTELALEGALAPGADGPRFTGTLDAQSEDLRALLGWLGLAAPQIPADRLRQAALEAKLAASPGRIDVTRLDLTIDDSHLTGAATVALRRRIALGARLALDQINLDAYLPDGAVPGGAAGLLAGFDANLDATAGRLTWRGQPVRGLHAVARLEGGALSIQAAEIADLGGARATASGLVSGLGGPALSWHAAFSFAGPELSHLLRVALPGAAGPARLLGPFTASGRCAGDSGTTTAELDLGALGGSLAASGRLAGDGGFAAKLSATKLDLGAALRAAFGSSPLGGAADLELTLSAAPGGASGRLARLRGAGRLAGRDGSIDWLDLSALGAGLASAGSPGDLADLLRGAGGATAYQSLAARLDIAGGVLAAEDLSLVTASGTAAGAARVDLADGRLDGEVALRLAALPDLPPLPLRLAGTAARPGAVLDAAAIAAYLAARTSPPSR